MSEITVARRYARALNERAEADGLTEKVDEDVELIRASLDGSRELVQFFESPIISREKKESVIDELFFERLQPLTLNFLKLLVEKKREDLFPAVVEAYRNLRNQQLGIVEAQAKAARPLSDAEEEKLIQALEDATGKRIRLEVEQHPSLVGGLVVRVGDTVYDGSVRHQLASLREQLEHGSFNVN